MQIDPKAGHQDMDYAEHMGTYKTFCGLMLWGTIACIVLIAAMGFFLT